MSNTIFIEQGDQGCPTGSSPMSIYSKGQEKTACGVSSDNASTAYPGLFFSDDQPRIKYLNSSGNERQFYYSGAPIFKKENDGNCYGYNQGTKSLVSENCCSQSPGNVCVLPNDAVKSDPNDWVYNSIRYLGENCEKSCNPDDYANCKLRMSSNGCETCPPNGCGKYANCSNGKCFCKNGYTCGKSCKIVYIYLLISIAVIILLIFSIFFKKYKMSKINGI